MKKTIIAAMTFALFCTAHAGKPVHWPTPEELFKNLPTPKVIEGGARQFVLYDGNFAVSGDREKVCILFSESWDNISKETVVTAQLACCVHITTLCTNLIPGWIGCGSSISSVMAIVNSGSQPVNLWYSGFRIEIAAAKGYKVVIITRADAK